MSTRQVAEETPAAPAASRQRATRLVTLIGLTLGLGYLIVLGGTFLKGDFLIDREGRPIANDFVNVVAAGQLALEGEPAAAYDWPPHKQAEVRAIGHDFETITAGIIRRRSFLLRRHSRPCLISLRRWSGC